MKNINNRSTEYDIDDIFLERHSPRAMSGQAVSRNEIMTLLDAAHWAPSASNVQPWRFLYAIKGTEDFNLFLSFLTERNQLWCKNAGALIIELSKKTNNEKMVPTHSFDAGSAWENLALQGSKMNLVIHGMAGYNLEPLVKELNISDEYKVEVMIAMGKPGKREDLPEELQEREKPSLRKDLKEIVFEGKEGSKQLK